MYSKLTNMITYQSPPTPAEYRRLTLNNPMSLLLVDPLLPWVEGCSLNGNQSSNAHQATQPDRTEDSTEVQPSSESSPDEEVIDPVEPNVTPTLTPIINPYSVLREIIPNYDRVYGEIPMFFRTYHLACVDCKVGWSSPLMKARAGLCCRRCSKLIRPYAQTDHVTPYRGVGRCYGQFHCPECRYCWYSNRSEAHRGQPCMDCGMRVFPIIQIPEGFQTVCLPNFFFEFPNHDEDFGDEIKADHLYLKPGSKVNLSPDFYWPCSEEGEDVVDYTCDRIQWGCRVPFGYTFDDSETQTHDGSDDEDQEETEEGQGCSKGDNTHLLTFDPPEFITSSEQQSSEAPTQEGPISESK